MFSSITYLGTVVIYVIYYMLCYMLYVVIYVVIMLTLYVMTITHTCDMHLYL